MRNSHGKYYASTECESAEAWQGTRPKCEDALVFKYADSTCEAVLVVLTSFETLHASFDCIKWHRGIPVMSFS
jgi:hypothetical protein